jgi:hypothetical protein
MSQSELTQPAHVPEKWTPVFRKGHAPTQDDERLALVPTASADMRAGRVWGLWTTFGWSLLAFLAELAVIASVGFLYRLWHTSGGGQPVGQSLPAALLPPSSPGAEQRRAALDCYAYLSGRPHSLDSAQ